MGFFDTSDKKIAAPGDPQTSGGDSSATALQGKTSHPFPLFENIASFDSNFDDSEAANETLSLSDYISRHLGNGSKKAKPNTTPILPSIQLQPSVLSQAETAKPERQNGHFLNTIDSDFTAGLEQYMPTPLFRLSVTKTRLDTEVEQLRNRIRQYEQLAPTTPNKLVDPQQMKIYRERLIVLEAHLAQVEIELSALLTAKRFFQGLADSGECLKPVGIFFNQLQQALSGVIFGKRYAHLKETNKQLQILQSLIRQRMRDPNLSEGEMGRLISHYDHLLTEATQDAIIVNNRFRQRGPIRLT